MYEVGLALACRHSSEVLLVRDDKDKFLFDVSTVPHMQIDFTDTVMAIAQLRDELNARLKERQYYSDARVEIALSRLGNVEVKLLIDLTFMDNDLARGWDAKDIVYSAHQAAVDRLLEMQILQAVGKFEKDIPGYRLSPLGRRVAEAVIDKWPHLARAASYDDRLLWGRVKGESGNDAS
jgi:hypothetical protein